MNRLMPQAYNIYVSNDLNSWGEPVLSRTDNKNVVSEELLGSKVSGRYVKLEVTENERVS